MPDDDFEVEILENEVVVVHMNEGQVYHFPIELDGTVSLNGSYLEPNREAEQWTRIHVLEAYKAAKTHSIVRNNSSRLDFDRDRRRRPFRYCYRTLGATHSRPKITNPTPGSLPCQKRTRSSPVGAYRLPGRICDPHAAAADAGIGRRGIVGGAS
jgi:hypothetical protein